MSKVSVIGLGKIGLPLAVQFASKGHHVIGVDINRSTVDTINKGYEPFPGEAHLQATLQQVIDNGNFSATTSYLEAIPNSDVIVVVVPLFVNDDGVPDFQWMDQATEELATHLTSNTLVAYETTLPVGTTRTRWKPMIERISGLVEGEDFHLVFSPERVLTGRVFEDLRRYPKLIGALSPPGSVQARQFYESALDFDKRADLNKANGVWDLGSAEAAEMAKLAETTYRDVNIGLANEFARFAGEHGIDIYSVIEASNSQPYSHIHRPGIAVGGHCIPVYPRLYLWNDPHADIVRTARSTNLSMPKTAVNILEDAHGSVRNQHVVVLGASYRGGVKETAFSGVFSTVEELRTRGAVVSVHDPLYSHEELVNMGFEPYQIGEETDAAVIQADHDEYRSLTPKDLPGIQTLLDGRNITDPQRWASVTHRVIGRPASGTVEQEIDV